MKIEMAIHTEVPRSSVPKLSAESNVIFGFLMLHIYLLLIEQEGFYRVTDPNGREISISFCQFHNGGEFISKGRFYRLAAVGTYSRVGAIDFFVMDERKMAFDWQGLSLYPIGLKMEGELNMHFSATPGGPNSFSGWDDELYMIHRGVSQDLLIEIRGHGFLDDIMTADFIARGAGYYTLRPEHVDPGLIRPLD